MSWTSLAIYIYKTEESDKVLSFFKATNGYGYISLQTVNMWSQYLNIFLSICCALSTIKYLRLFRFNRRIYSLILTLNNVKGELYWFAVIFMIVFFAFVQCQYLLLYQVINGYQFFITTMETMFQIMLGKFNSNSLQTDAPLMGLIIFVVFNLVIVIILVNMFISILNDGFDMVRKETKVKSDDTEMFHFLWQKAKKTFGFENEIDQREQENKARQEYLDFTKTLTVKVHDLLYKVIENATESKMLENQPVVEAKESSDTHGNETSAVVQSKVEANILKRKEFHKKNTAFDENGNPNLSKTPNPY